MADTITSPTGPTEIKNADGTSLSIKIKDPDTLLTKETKMSFILRVAKDIFYSHDSNVNTAKQSAKNAITMAKAFYTEIVKSGVVKEYKKKEGNKEIIYLEY